MKNREKKKSIWTRFKRVGLGLLVLTAGILVLNRMMDILVSKMYFIPWPIFSDYRYPPEVEKLFIPTKDGPHLQAWWIRGKRGKNPKSIAILYLHGNGGNLAAQHSQFQFIPELGFDVLAVDYRGFGVSEGRVSREGLLEDARAGLRKLKELAPDRPLGVVGFSMGATYALQLAAHEKGIDRMVVIAPFTTFREIGEVNLRRWGLSPRWAGIWGWVLIPNGLDPLEAASEPSMPPALLVQGTADGIIPVEMGNKVYQAYTGPKKWFPMEGYHHGDFHRGPLGGKFLDIFERWMTGNIKELAMRERKS